MMCPRMADATAGSLLIIIAVVSGTLGEIDVTIKVPIAVAENSTVNMTCDYNLYGKPLYAVKWYKGRNEFYRYIQKELPPKTVFPPLGPKVDLFHSNERNLILRHVDPSMAGNYRCEVSTDSPFFTKVVSSFLHVVRLPDGKPSLRTEKPRYSIGDTIRGNCSAPPSNPPANITWTVNQVAINSSFVRHIPSRMNENRTITMTIAGFEFEPDSFSNGRLHIICRVQVFHLYQEKVTVVLEEERPKLASVLGTRESSHNQSPAKNAELLLVVLTIAKAFLSSMR